MSFRTLTTSALAAVACAQVNTGMTASMDISIIEQAKDVYFDSIVNTINNLQLPDVYEDSHHYLIENSFVMNERTGDVTISTDLANNAIVLRCDNLSGTFYSGSFKYKTLGIFTAKGHLDVVIDTIAIQFGIGFATQAGSDGRLLPYIKGVDIVSDIDRWDIDIQIHGNIFADFASAFEVFFVGSVVDGINSAIESTLSTTAPNWANSALLTGDAYLPMPIHSDSWKVDWETAVAVQVTESYLAASVKGLFFDFRIGEEDPGVTIPTLPLHLDTQTQEFQAFVSTYSLDTFLGSYLEVGKLQYWFNADDVPATSANQLNTTSLEKVFPGITDYYGADVPVDVLTSVTSLDRIGISADDEQMSGYGIAQLELWVHMADGTREMALQMEATETNFIFSAAVTGMDVFIDIEKINSAKIVIDSCTFADPSAFKFKIELNNLARFCLSKLNPWLAGNPIPIPSNIGGIFELSDLFLGYFDDYVYVGATPTFLAPTVESFVQ